MENQVQIFKNSSFGDVRTTTVNGEPMFVGKDIAKILGYTNTRKALADHVDPDDKGVTICYSLGGNQETTLINESGLYSLILSSKLPTAKEFKRWVTSEVLPAIRRYGLYAADELLADPDLAIAAFTALKEAREKVKALETTVEFQSQQIAELQSKVGFYDQVMGTTDLLPITIIAKQYGRSGVWMNRYLHEQGVQYKLPNGEWLLYAKYAMYGYTGMKTFTFTASNGTTRVRTRMYWTQTGRKFIHDLMVCDGLDRKP